MQNFLKPIIVVSLFKLLIGSFFASEDTYRWFIPFVDYFVTNFDNPWQYFYNIGEIMVFPYGPVMLYPLALVTLILSPLAFIFGSSLPLISLSLTLLLFDLGIYFLLIKLLEGYERKVFYLYFCCPLVFYINYIYTQIDIIPTFFVILSVFLLFKSKYRASAFILGLAINAKLSSALALIFIATYLFKKSKTESVVYSVVAYLTFYILQYPFYNSIGFLEIVKKSSVQTWVYDLYINYSNQSLLLLITPLLLGLFYLNFISYSKISKSTLLMYLALGFMSLVMFVSPVPGWYMWVYPLIVFCFIKYIDFPRFAIIGLNGFYLLYFLFSTKFSEFGLFSLFSINSFVTTTETQFNSLLFTPLLAIMIYIMFLILRLGNEHNNLFNYRTNPIMVGVGGDSGSGKNYMYNLISELFSNDTLCVEGDDDHKWERGHQQWQAYTHLNPKANNLYVQFDNTIDLKKGRSVYKSNYDHGTGNFSNPNAVSPNDTIFFLGLHAFYLPQMRGLFDLKIFLDPEEKLRQEWKIDRDKKERNYDKKTITENIAKRNPDSQNYIRPQLKFADIVIRNKTKNGKFYTTFVIKNEWDLSQLINHIEGKVDNNFAFSHTFDYQNDTQIIKFSGKIKKTFFDHYLNDLVISNDLFDINFPKGENAQNLMTQVIVLTMLSHIAKK